MLNEMRQTCGFVKFGGDVSYGEFELRLLFSLMVPLSPSASSSLDPVRDSPTEHHFQRYRLDQHGTPESSH
jgi:hypothetical protein